MRTIDFTTGPGAASADSIRVSDADPIALPDHAIFTADFARDGHDLILSAPGQPDLRLVDYFLQDTPPDLVADNGAVLRGDLAARLAGPIMPGQYAQVGDAPATDPIGQVETLEGAAWAERADGTRVRLDVGSKIYENDVLVTEGGKLSVTFADGTIFTLAADSRMVIDALVYDAESEDGNSGAFSLIEGGFVFIAGEVARTGGMDVNTPTATMGIRGTTVLVEITTVNGVSTVEVSLNTDPDGGQGAFELRDLDGNLIAFIDSTDTKWIVSPIEGETREVARTTDDLADDQALLLDAVRAYALAFERVDAGGTFVELASNQTSGTNGPQVDDDDGTLGNDSDIDNDTSPPPPPSGGTGGGTTPNPPATGGGATPINAAPDARNDVKTLLEDGRATGNVLTNDSDPDGDDLSVIINTRPKHGTLTIDADGNYSYRPHADYNGTDSFTYTVSDGNGGTDTATVTFTVTPVNDDPVATPETLTVAEDGSAVVYPSFDTTDVDGDEVFISDFGQGANGTVTEDGEGGLVYTPNADFNGSDSFTYTVSDGNGGTDTETVSVTVTPVNDDPVATPETLTVAEDGSAVVYPSFDTTDVDGDEVFISDFGQGANGTVTEDGEGGLVYTPNADFNGTDSFTYTVSDGNGGTDTETVSVTVTPVNDDPVATPESLTVAEDGSAVIYPSFETTDVDGDEVFISDFGQGANGTVTEDGEGGLVYTPNADFNGTDSFTYTVSDGNGGTDTETVSVTVTPVNDDPVATPETLTVAEDGSAVVYPSFDTTDVDGDEVFISDFGQGANGTVTEDGEGGLVYTPNADFNGFDSFTYTVSDGNGGTDTETVTVTVTPVNDDPVATPETLTVAEDGSAVVYPSFDTTDVDGDEVFISDFGQGANGTVTEDGEGGLVYTPNADFNGTDSFTYTVSDGNGGTDTETVSVTVTPVNDDPVANDDVVSTTTGILLFDNESVIDSNNDVPAYDEAQTLVASLESFGHEVEITEALDAAGLSAALEGKSIFVLPEQEQAALGTFMSEAGQDVIRDFVGNGGTMFMGMDYRGTLNDLFGFSTSYSTAGSFEITDAAIGTPFEGGPASLQPHSATHGLLASSLPPGAVSLYESSTGYVAVALLPYGEGQILYLGWDWFSAMPLGEMDGGWLEVLDRATALGDTAPISEGSVTVIAEADLLANDTDIDGDTLFILSVSATSAAGATVSFADGEVRYDPTDVAAFDALGEGESLSDTFTYTVSDGNGGTDTATVTVVVAGVNDDPVAQNSVLEVEADGSATGQVVATDVDGDTLTYTLATAPEHGIVVLGADGAYTYTPDEGYVGFDSFVMLVSDGNGGSDTATVTLEVAQEAYPVSEDQSISMALSEEPVGDAPAGNLRIGVGEVQSNTINLSFALDASGSVGSAGWANIENAIYDAVEQLSGQFDGSATIVNVQIIQYGLGVYADLRYDLNDPALLTAIQSLEFANGSQTDWHLAMDASHAFFSSQDPSDTNILYFVTDGVPSGSTWEASLATLNGAAYDVDIQAFGIGTGFNTSQLQQVDSDGSPTAVSDSAALLEAIQQSPLFAAQLVELSLSLVADGVDHGVIADETSPALTSDGLNFNLPLADIAGIGELLGEENFFSASAVFDLDGDLNTTDDRVTINSFERIAKHDTAQTLTGTDGPDLILGSDEDDVLSGGEGDDILIGFSGTDIFDGGPGRDLLELATGAAPNLIETLAGSDIEAIGLHNGVADTLFIDATDVINLSSTADTDLELLLNEALGDSATILGEVGDSITLMPEGSGSWETAATGVDDGKGNTLDIYQFVEGGVVMATLGIDDDVTVNIPVLT